MAAKSIKQSPRWTRAWTTRRIGVGTRVVLLRGVVTERVTGIVNEVRILPHLKRFVIQADNGGTHYASESEVALEDDPTLTPLGPSMHVE